MLVLKHQSQRLNIIFLTNRFGNEINGLSYFQGIYEYPVVSDLATGGFCIRYIE